MTKKLKTPKKELAYSEITDIVYWVDGRGQKTNVSSQFEYILGLMTRRWSKGKKGKGFKIRMTNKKNPKDSYAVEVTEVDHYEVKEDADI